MIPPESKPVQPPRTGEIVTIATLGRRFLATAVDMIILFFILLFVMMVTVAAHLLDLTQYENGLTWPPRQDVPTWLLVLAYGLVFAYFTLCELRGTTPGKRLFHLSVKMDDGSAPTPTAVVLRNLVRIPELIFYYIPSAISCLVHPRNKRLGDIVAHTVVVQRTVPTAARWGPQAAAPSSALHLSPGSQPAAPEPDAWAPFAQSPDDAVAALKAAALALHGAHANYQHFSELELAKGAAEEGAEPEYAPEYIAAWYTLTDAVHRLKQARAAASQAAARSTTSLDAEIAARADLQHLMRELAPYLDAGADAEIHDAYMSVARGETA